MMLIVALTFIGVFALVALPLLSRAADTSKHEKQVRTTLESALSTESTEVREQIINLRKSELLSSIPWLNRRLVKMEVGPAVQRFIEQAGLKWTAGTLLAGSFLLFTVATYAVYMRFRAILPGLGVGLLLGLLPIFFVYRKRARRFGKFEEGLPGSLDMMVSALRAGHSLVAAMGVVAREAADPIGPEFRVCFEEQNFGLEMKDALDNLIKRVPLQDLRITITAIMIQKESGGNLAEVLDKTAYAIRERFRLRREVKTKTAQGRMTGWVLTLLPMVLGVALFFMDPKMMSVLWTNPFGVKMLWGAGIMMVIGALLINHIVNLDV
ncbi:MAG TPA: type II secretion system F family protein [Terracidiphilus sp.]|nr:type II secretion system F family protein [Terracidiphilus sp.]